MDVKQVANSVSCWLWSQGVEIMVNSFYHNLVVHVRLMRLSRANKSERSLGVQQGDEWWPFVMWRPGKSSASQCLLPGAFLCLSDRPSEWATMIGARL